MKLGKGVLLGLFSMTMLLAGDLSMAAPPATNPGAPFQMLADQHLQIQERVDQIDEILQFWVPETVEQVEFKVSLPVVQAHVDTTACAAGFPACGLNEAGAPATDQNDQPIRMVVLVARNGVGVEGLTAGAFEFDNAFFPAGGPKAVFCSSNCGPMWFYEGGSGLYTMFLEPLLDENWSAGQYAAAVKVRFAVVDPYVSDARGTTLVTFEIPSALSPID